MTTTTIFVLAVFAGVVLWGLLVSGKLPKPFRARQCQGRFWKEAFPAASNNEIREFLNTFTEAFAFSDREKLKFNPNDTILQIYRALYPRKWMADALEVETLAEDFESKYGVKFESIWHDGLSLGELFEASSQGVRS